MFSFLQGHPDFPSCFLSEGFLKLLWGPMWFLPVVSRCLLCWIFTLCWQVWRQLLGAGQVWAHCLILDGEKILMCNLCVVLTASKETDACPHDPEAVCPRHPSPELTCQEGGHDIHSFSRQRRPWDTCSRPGRNGGRGVPLAGTLARHARSLSRILPTLSSRGAARLALSPLQIPGFLQDTWPGPCPPPSATSRVPDRDSHGP